jgi:hypothetical protein
VVAGDELGQQEVGAGRGLDGVLQANVIDWSLSSTVRWTWPS